MKNIWDKLRPEYKQRIRKHQEKYRTAPQKIEESLKSIVFWGELSIEDLRDFYTWTDMCLTEMTWEDTFGSRFLIEENK
tara:strand:+ start:343 stop:579 length:237 start_codon:yes stop_codon:yes gene_type:complete